MPDLPHAEAPIHGSPDGGGPSAPGGWSDVEQGFLSKHGRFLQALVDLLPDMVFIKSVVGDRFTLVLVNDAYCRMTGAERSEILGRTVHDTYPRDIADVYHAKDEEVVRSGQINRNDEWIVSRDGNRALIETIKVPYTDADGRVTAIIGVSRDITERRRLADERERLLAQLRELSDTDALTGIANRRQFDRQLEIEWRRAARERQPLAIIFMDVDYFKNYNDRYGHAAGDTCLQSVAAAIAGLARRPGDLVARYGGEEFVGMFPNTDDADGLLAQRSLEAVRALRIPHADSRAADIVTVSAGVASAVPESGVDPRALLRKADELTYEAKAAGRNQVRRAQVEFGVPT